MTISEQDKKSVEEERKKSFTTKRATVEGLENGLFKIFPALDHGLVRVIDYMGAVSYTHLTLPTIVCV